MLVVELDSDSLALLPLVALVVVVLDLVLPLAAYIPAADVVPVAEVLIELAGMNAPPACFTMLIFILQPIQLSYRFSYFRKFWMLN